MSIVPLAAAGSARHTPSEPLTAPLLLRADSSAQSGTGHVMRCLALAEEWTHRGGAARYVGACGSTALRQRIADAQVGCVPLQRAFPDPADLNTVLDVAGRFSDGTSARPWVVVDGYHFDAAYHRALREGGCRVLVIDDNAHLAMYSGDVLLNQNLHAEHLPYHCDAETVLLLGTRYTLTRREFTREIQHRVTPQVARRVLVTLGGGGAARREVDVLAALARFSGIEVVVVVGPGSPDYEVVQDAASLLGGGTRVVQNPASMADLAAWADVAVTGGGVTLLELAAMGVPSIALVLAGNQAQGVAACVDAGAATTVDVEAFEFEERLGRELAALLGDASRREQLTRNAQRLVDGLGAARVCDVLDVLAKPECGPTGTIRPAALDDARQVWRLSNEPSVRENSISQSSIAWDEHLQWYSRVLTSPDVRLWVVDVGGLVIAQVRYTRIDSVTIEVHFSVAPAFRGRGVGTMALTNTWRAACEALSVARVIGRVLPGNSASIRAFKSAGFTRIPDDASDERRFHVFEQRLP